MHDFSFFKGYIYKFIANATWAFILVGIWFFNTFFRSQLNVDCLFEIRHITGTQVAKFLIKRCETCLHGRATLHEGENNRYFPGTFCLLFALEAM